MATYTPPKLTNAQLAALWNNVKNGRGPFDNGLQAQLGITTQAQAAAVLETQQVIAYLQKNSTLSSSILDPTSPTVNSGVNAVVNTIPGVSTVADLIKVVTSLSFWERVGEAILGAILLILGLRALTGNSNDPVAVIGKVARKAAPGV